MLLTNERNKLDNLICDKNDRSLRDRQSPSGNEVYLEESTFCGRTKKS